MQGSMVPGRSLGRSGCGMVTAGACDQLHVLGHVWAWPVSEVAAHPFAQVVFARRELRQCRMVGVEVGGDKYHAKSGGHRFEND